MLSSIAGQNFWLDRKIRLWTRSQLAAQLALHGGRVGDSLPPEVDYVVIDPTRWDENAASPPQEQAQALGIAVLNLDARYALLCPERDEALALLRDRLTNRDHLEKLLPLACSTPEIDLANADLMGLDLSRFTFRRCDLSGANLTGANLRSAALVALQGVDLTSAGSLQAAQTDYRPNETLPEDYYAL